MEDSVLIKAQEKRLKKMRESLSALHFLTDVEIEHILKGLENRPPIAFQEIQHLITEGKSKQNDFIKKAIKRDKTFGQKLKSALQKKYKEIKEKVTKDEKAKAEQILEKVKKL